MATLMMSAALPCSTEFTARRSPSETLAEVVGTQLGHRPSAPENGGHVAGLEGVGDDLLAKDLDLRVLREVGIDEGARLVQGHVDLFRQAERERPYMMPKLVALARSRWVFVTCSTGMPATAAAVTRWTSSPRR